MIKRNIVNDGGRFLVAVVVIVAVVVVIVTVVVYGEGRHVCNCGS